MCMHAFARAAAWHALGRCSQLNNTGCPCRCCIGERVAGGLSLRIQQLDVR